MQKGFFQLKKWMLLPSLLLFLLSCRKDKDDSPVIEKEISLTGFNKIYAGESFHLVITKGNEFHIKVKGPSHSVNDIDWGTANNILDIQYTHHENNRPIIDIVVTLPVLVSVNLSGAAKATVNGFQDATNVVRTILSGASECTLNGTGINTQVDISGASELNVNGSTASLYGTLSGAGKMNAYNLTATEVDISASGGSIAKVKVVNSFFAEASGGSCIYYKGNPPVKNIQTSGGGQVIREL